MYYASVQDDPYANDLLAQREEAEVIRVAKEAAWREGWREGSRIGAIPRNPYTILPRA